MKTLRREIHPVIRVLDEKRGLVEYVASNEKLDSYNEIIRADGWRFDDFAKNAPFVDSHDYSSINCVLGRVVDYRVSGKNLVETVQWAIDVEDPTGHPSHKAQWGFQMTKAGYLKAVSVGFVPVQVVTPFDRDPAGWLENCADLKLDPNETDCRCIYVQQQQKELSACVIGANPDAVAQIGKAYQAGILDDSAIQSFSEQSPEFARAFEQIQHRSRGYSFPSATKSAGGLQLLAAIGEKQSSTPHQSPMKKTDFLTQFDRLTGKTKGEFEKLEFARRDGSTSDLERIIRRAVAAVAQEKQASYGNPIARYFESNPERRLFWNGIARQISGCLKIGTPEHRAVVAAFGGSTDLKENARRISETRAVDGFNLQSSFGSGLLLAVPVADEVYDLLLHYGAYKYLGLRKMIGQYTLFAQATGFPTAIFITPNQQGQATIPADTTLTGTPTTPVANTIACLINTSREWLADEKVDLSEALFSMFIQGLAARIDYGAFQGSGADDIYNGMTTGIFTHQAIKTVNSVKGAATITGLARQDFLNVVSQVSTAALQRMDEQPPRWYISPTFIPMLLQLRDGATSNYLLRTPADTGGEWLLVGFPVTWATQAPAVNAVGSKVAAFGNPDAYLVGLHESFEITKSENGPLFANNQAQFRATGRGQSLLRQSSGFATLTLQ